MDADTPAPADSKLFLNQVDDLYGNLGFTNAAVILIASFLAWILWPVAGNQGLVPWLGCVLLLNVWSILLAFAYRRRRVALDEARAKVWLRVYIAGGLLSGLSWGCLLLLVVPPQATVHLLAAIFIMAGLVTASAASLSSLKYGFAVFSVPAILPGATYLIYLNESVTFLLGSALLAFLLFISFVALRIHRTLFYSLRKQVEVSNRLSLLETEKRELLQKLDNLKRQLERDQGELQQLRGSLKHKPLPAAGLRRAHDFHDLRFVSLLDQLTGGVWDLNMKTGEMSFSPGWLAMLGYDEATAPRQLETWTSLLHPEDRLTVLNRLHAFADGSLPEFASSHRLRSGKGDWVWVMARAHGVIWGSFGELLNIAGMELHVPESGEGADRSLDLLNFDINAWLVTPEVFRRRCEQLVATAGLDGIEHSLCHIRIVRLHDAYDDNPALDEVRLYEVGRVLLNEFRHGDALLRLGEDSFALLMAFCRAEDALGKALTLQQRLQRLQVNFKGMPLPLVAGIGITAITQDSRDIDALLQQARSACDLAITGSASLVHLHQGEGQPSEADPLRRELVRLVQHGMRQHELHIRTAPMQAVDPAAAEPRQLVMVTASLGPGEPQKATAANINGQARQQRLDTTIDIHVIGNIMSWLGCGPAQRRYFYECADASCLDADFVELLRQQLLRLPAGSAGLCLAISERVWLAEPEASAHFLTVLHAAGAMTALTRFGDPAGLAALGHRGPVDLVKLDGSLLHNIDQDRAKGITVKYIADMVHVAGIRSIAELAEAAVTPGLLQGMGIDFLQAAPATSAPV